MTSGKALAMKRPMPLPVSCSANWNAPTGGLSSGIASGASPHFNAMRFASKFGKWHCTKPMGGVGHSFLPVRNWTRTANFSKMNAGGSNTPTLLKFTDPNAAAEFSAAAIRAVQDYELGLDDTLELLP